MQEIHPQTRQIPIMQPMHLPPKRCMLPHASMLQKQTRKQPSTDQLI